MPGRRIGLVILANGGGKSSLLVGFLLSAIYDPELGRAEGRARIDSLAGWVSTRVADQQQGITADLARRAGKPQTTAHPLAAYAGTYANPERGHIVWTVEAGTLTMRMGAAVGEVEVYDGAADRFRVEIFGSGNIAGFRFEAGAERAASVSIMGTVFARVGP